MMPHTRYPSKVNQNEDLDVGFQQYNQLEVKRGVWDCKDKRSRMHDSGHFGINTKLTSSYVQLGQNSMLRFQHELLLGM
jgi:hypothetical protein